MTDPRDEARLNDWIEGVADPADAAAVEAWLAADPALAARVEAMRADRALLGSIPAPVMPAELRAAIDDRVERMLLLGAVGDGEVLASLDPQAGDPPLAPAASDAPALEFPGDETARWRARRRDRRRRRVLAGAGAGLALAASAALLVLLVPGPGGGAGEPADGTLAGGPGAADGDASPGTPAANAPRVAPPFTPGREALVVHGLPAATVAPDGPGGAAALAAADEPAAATSPDARDARDARAAVPAVRLAGLAAPELERRLAAALGEDATLTRNLTTDAVARLVPRGRTPAADPLWADLDAARGGRADEDWRRRLDERLAGTLPGTGGPAANGNAAEAGRVIAGDPDARPGWGEQIVFSESGAGWTVSVPAGRVAEVLAVIDAMGPGGSRLLAVDPVRWRADEAPDGWRAVRDELRRLAREAPDRIVHLPVMLAD